MLLHRCIERSSGVKLANCLVNDVELLHFAATSKLPNTPPCRAISNSVHRRRMRKLLQMMMVASCGGADPTTADALPPSPDAAENEVGELLVEQGNLQGSDQTVAAAGFGADLDIVVISRDDGPCHVEQRTRILSTLVGAGAIAVSGPGGTLSLSGSMNQYFAMIPGFKYAAGAALTFTGTGDVVPAFSAMFAFPATITVTSPAPIAVHKSGITATWTPTTGSVVVILTHYPSSSQGNFVTCTYDGASGTGGVPSTALAELVNGTNANFTVATATDMTSMVGAYAIELQALFVGQQVTVPVQP